MQINNLKSYKTISSIDIYKNVKKVLNDRNIDNKLELLRFTGKRTNKKGKKVKSTRHVMSFRLLDRELKINGDIVNPQLYIENDYRPGRALKVSFGLYRRICENGLTLDCPLFSDRIIHRNDNVYTNQWVKQLEYQIVAYLDHIDEILKTFEVKNFSIKEDSIVDILTKLNDDKKISKKDLTAIHEIISHGEYRVEDNPVTVWGLYNIINEQVRLHSRSNIAAYDKNKGLFEMIYSLAA